jgi:hypothetical protein
MRPYNTHKLKFRSKRCVFLGYSNVHKGFKCLDVAEGRVYISRDVVFDENIFPFQELHPNAGARLRKEILLLSPNLLNPSSGDELAFDPDLINSSNHDDPDQDCSDVLGVQEENSVQNHALDGDTEHYFMQDAASTGAGHGVDLMAPTVPAPATGSAPDSAAGPSSPRTLSQPHTSNPSAPGGASDGRGPLRCPALPELAVESVPRPLPVRSRPTARPCSLLRRRGTAYHPRIRRRRPDPLHRLLDRLQHRRDHLCHLVLLLLMLRLLLSDR